MYTYGMQTQKIIESLGYTASEAKVYMAALQLGECHVSDIAQKVRLPRSTTQTIVDSLHKKGLMNFYVRKRYKYWAAERPARLLDMLKEREEAIHAAIPRLDAIRHGDDFKPHVKILEGIDEIRSVYENMLETKQPILSIIPWDEWVQLLGRGFMEDFIESRVRHFLHIRMLAPRTALTAELKARDAQELRQLRFLPEDLHIHTTTFIFGNKVVIISLNKKLPTAVLIEDPNICHTETVFFEELWNRSR